MKIQKYRFSSEEIDTASLDRLVWHRFVRDREVEIVFAALGQRFQNALEVGAGDGGTSVLLSGHCEKLTCTELQETGNSLIGAFRSRNIPNVIYELCDARDLSRFDNDTFDLVISSNVLEHVDPVSSAIHECARVLKKGGVMVHSVPSRDWKLFNSLVGLLALGVRPSVHGIASSNFREFLEFGESRWIKKFESANLTVERVLRLPFYHGHGPRVIPLIKIGNGVGLKSSSAFIVRK